MTETDEPRIITLADEAAVAEAAAERIATVLGSAVAERGRADWMTTGGSSPIDIYRRLAAMPLRDRMPWSDIHVWWTDDRYVPRDHPLSNVRAFDDIVLDMAGREAGVAMGRSPLPIRVDQLHPFRTGEAIGAARGPEGAAADMVAELAASGLEVRDGWPVMDLILLGIGGDGHLLSVFPGSGAFDSTDWALAVPAPTHIEPHVARVTMHPSIITAAREVLVTVTGGSKADIIETLLRGQRDPRRWPGQVARRPGASWILDQAAAARLGR
ncbi:MAG TPA: 6-phosphogluconolactonase [Candidatus Saccharimonadales bacterium]|nr:6-phosphogluconolactonase [Candidatus Saccharimonadales bacterium]